MAGMFYSLKETAEKLGKSENDLRKLVQTGKLRLFKDGSHELFKVDEVQALMAERLDVPAEAEEEALPLEPAAEEDLSELLETGAPAAEEGPFDTNELLGLEPETPAEAPAEEELSVQEPSGVEEELAALEPLAEEDVPVFEPEGGEADASSELALAPELTDEKTSDEDELLFLEEDEQPAAESTEELTAELAAETGDEIALAPETGIASGSDITDMDTALTGEGISVLGETDTEYSVTEDSMAETVGPAGSAGSAAGTAGGTGTSGLGEASLEEEEDLNLDSFGSGSGLLDLSLQADDTSLGGILDEIYTADGGEEAAAGAEAGSMEDITAEADHAPEEELAAPEAAMAAPVAVPTFAAYAETPPDAQSNILGMLLFLPLLALLYTTIVVVSAQRGVMPGILEAVQGMFLYIVVGALVVAGIVTGASFVVGGEKAPKAAKVKKEKPAKAEKPKKEKKAKEAAAAEKPAKEKKSFFGKKKAKK